MSKTNDSSSLHKDAASDHEATAKQHRHAAECHDNNKLSDAKTSSKSAMECSNKAHKHSETACASSAK